MVMLLSAERLFSLPDKQRLPAILAESRKYQNLVWTKLAEQVLAASMSSSVASRRPTNSGMATSCAKCSKMTPTMSMGGLLRVLMRLVFLLYAEDRSLLSSDEVYQKYYSVIGLFERLRADAGPTPTRWTTASAHGGHYLTLFRLVYDGGQHGGLKLLARRGYLFDPDRYPFLEGRGTRSWELGSGATGEGVGSGEFGGGEDQVESDSPPPKSQIPIPRISDGVYSRVLQNLLILDGERLSYRTLDVEQIGSVYETMMGFTLEVAQGRSMAIKPTKPHGGRRQRSTWMSCFWSSHPIA